VADTTVTCQRCRARVAGFWAETCWYCTGDLCYQCWEDHGHCGHAEAVAINEASRGMTHEQRAAIARALDPAAEHLSPPTKVPPA
jgi:hypothetical protein